MLGKTGNQMVQIVQLCKRKDTVNTLSIYALYLIPYILKKKGEGVIGNEIMQFKIFYSWKR